MTLIEPCPILVAAGEGNMIGAILMKRAARQGYAAISRQDLDAIDRIFREDAVFEFPGETARSGRFEGRAHIHEWFAEWFERMPETRFTIRHVSVENGCSFTRSNLVHVGWDLAEADREGNRYHVTGVSAVTVDGGKVRHLKDYIFDQPLLASIWPPMV